MSSTPAIEARSLSSLTSLASNPPPYPRNPTHVRHEPLVLYIARVPGSRDVFLSPMKPREKVVTAEDIQNSLYFVHVEQPEDVQLVQSPSFQEPQYIDQRPPSSDGLHASAVHRKPVSNPTPGLPNAPKRKPVPGTLEPVHGFENMQNINAMNTHPSSSGLLAPGYTPRRSFETQYQEERRSLSSPRTPFGQAFPSGTYLTLIRRDPASGAQWNVARIEDPPVLDISSSGTNDAPIKRKTGAPIYIEVTNPGYSKFIHTESPMMPPLLSRGTDASSISRRSVQDHQINDANAPGEVVDPNEDGTFRRRLWMEGAKNFNGGFGHQRLNSYDSNMSGGSPRNSYEGARRDPFGVATPPFLTKENQPYSTIQVSEKQSTFRGYVFMSPWNGRCEFITGTGGSSLKCRHLIPGLQGAAPIALPVSELRFNLPTSSKATTPRSEDSSKRSSFFHRPRHNRYSSSVSDYHADSTDSVRQSFDRMDLSLGQEFAGGGFGGKQAKLGKLIVEDEGLKMVDLLVAANIALWWRAYQR